MGFIQILRKSLESEVVISHLFKLNYNPRIPVIHAFVEGKNDESFYGSFIRAKMEDHYNLKTYNCKGKDGVYFHFRKFAEKTRDNQALLFFVDKDIDDIIPVDYEIDEKIYESEYYSIENYVVTSRAVEQIWSEIFRQNSSSITVTPLVESFEVALSQAHEILLKVMGWVLVHRRSESGPNLDCIVTSDLLSLNDELEVIKTLDDSEMIKLLDTQTKVVTTKVLEEQLEDAELELSKFEAKQVIRGHNELDFLILFVNKLKMIVSQETKKISPRVDLTKGNAIDLLGPRTQIPKSLEHFLEKHLSRLT